MARFHLKFRNLDSRTLEVTEELFAAKPWRAAKVGQVQEAINEAQAWLDKVCGIYNVPLVCLVIGNERARTARPRDGLDHPAYNPDEVDEDVPSDEETQQMRLEERPALRIKKWSLLLLFKAFREHMLRSGYSQVGRTKKDDLHGWGCSLFYKVRPVMFRARVRQGRIKRIKPNELLATRPLTAAVQEVIEAGVDGAVETLDAVGQSVRVSAHNLNAGEDVESMNTRPLRRYASQVGVQNTWSKNKETILAELRNSDEFADKAREVRTQFEAVQ